MFPPPFLMVVMVFLVSKLTFPLLTLWVELMPKSSIFIPSDRSTFSKSSSESSGCLFANFRRACTYDLWSRGTLQAQYDFSPLRRSVLLMVTLVTVVSGAFRSSTSAYRVVLGCSPIFLIIRFTPCREILRGALDQGRLRVNWCFFHFLIIAPTVDSLSPNCFPIFL